MKYYPVPKGAPAYRRTHHAKAIDEYYLSGAIVEAYRARANLTIAYPIAKIVRTETVTLTREVPE